MTNMRCNECERPVLARGLCNAHYLQWRKHGHPTPNPLKVTLVGGTHKFCCECDDLKTLDQFPRRSDYDGYRNRCIECMKARKARWFREHREQINARKARYAREHPQEMKAAWARYYREHMEERKAHAKRYRKEHRDAENRRRSATQRRQRENLADGHVRGLIAQNIGLPRALIPQALVDAKREHLRLTRLLKEKAT